MGVWCVPIVGSSLEEAASQVEEAASIASLLEFRLDLFTDHDTERIKKIRANHRVIFTLRGGSQEEIRKFASLEPDYFDLESDLPENFLEELSRDFPQVKQIISYHNFSETPADLEGLFQGMKRRSASLYKIACQANSILDSLRMLDFVEKHRPILGMCMGEKGEVTRILGLLKGAPWIYVALDSFRKSAPGQLTIQDLKRFSPLTPETDIYGLIGSPISQSISHITHNKTMRDLQIPGVYVKMEILPNELSEFFSWARRSGLRGLSVTMPLKEAILPYLDEIHPDAKKIGAVNTLLFQEGKIYGWNTDGIGALDAIEAKQKVAGKRFMVLGAGGAARAIVFEAKRRGALVEVYNRTKERALQLAHEFAVVGRELDAFPSEGEIVINTTPDPLPILPEKIPPNSLVMDIKTLPKMTRFLEEAESRGCTLVFGYEMFVNQAVLQYIHWGYESRGLHSTLETHSLTHLFSSKVPEEQKLLADS
ncbi:MAG: Shikimate dehydrogenase (NADP(+)) [Chlamydiae bacterium]|nr:Shikimate dehydrogenase (NADP(+)) [Chlamydiota bacterium]